MKAESLSFPIPLDHGGQLIVEYVTGIDTPSGTGVFLCSSKAEDDIPLFVLTCAQAEALARTLEAVISLDLRSELAAVRQYNEDLLAMLEAEGRVHVH